VSFNFAIVINLLRTKVVVKQVVRKLKTTSSLQILNKCFLRTSRESQLIKKVINYIVDFYREKSIFNVHLELLFRLFKRTKKQTNTLKLVMQNLNKCLIAIIARKERRLQRSIVVVTNVIKSITTRDCKHIISICAQRVEKLVVVKVEQKI